ncbi:MAG: DUF2891 domain-containing protein [Pseudomonadota bacterium]
MKSILAVLGLVALAACSPTSELDTPEAEMTRAAIERPAPETTEDRFAILALDCIHREFPNKISHVMQSDSDIAAPRDLTPAFYGCFDWHSSVHGHWLLTRLLSTDPESVLADEMRAALAQSFTEDKLVGELAYYSAPGRASFERPYGIAWFLQLVAELDNSTDPQMAEWREVLRPLEIAIVDKTRTWLPNLAYPVRLGTHNQTAFAFGLMIDYARQVGDTAFETELVAKTLAFHSTDVACPLDYEPSGEDFLSPCLMEADLMRRVLSQDAFADWLTAFLPEVPTGGDDDWLEPGIVLDASDGKLVHLDGVNLSRAWALEGIASALPTGDARVASLLASARRHREVGIASVSDEHYSGSHWLASFATYLTTQRGISDTAAAP